MRALSSLAAAALLAASAPLCWSHLAEEKGDKECVAEPEAASSKESGCGCSALDRDVHVPDDDNPFNAFPQRGKESVAEELRRKVEETLGGQLQAEETPLVRIPGGVFTMGTDNPEIPGDGEGPARRVRVSPFDMQQYEVSNRQFANFVLETGYQTETETFGWTFCLDSTLSPHVLDKIEQKVAAVPWWVPVEGANWFHPSGPDSDVLSKDLLDHPVVHVTHGDARAYCEYLGLRLPREAEFERASRGGLENSLFPWGDELVPGGTYRANLWQGAFPKENLALDGYPYAAPVQAFGPQNKFGLYNIIGNVWEWVADAMTVRHRLHDAEGNILVDPQIEYSYERLNDPTVERVKKGGSYMCHISYCYRYRTASRSSNTADSSAQNLGFRCVGDIEE